MKNCKLFAKYLSSGFFLLFLLFTSCKKEKDFSNAIITLPENVLSVQTAAKIARAYLQKHSIDSARTVTVRLEETIQKNGVPYLYAFNAENNAGFVVISAEKNHIPVLANNNKGSFHAGKNLPPGLQIWLKKTTDIIDVIRTGPWMNTHTVTALAAWHLLEKDLHMPELGEDPYLKNLFSKIQRSDQVLRTNDLDLWAGMYFPEPTVQTMLPLINSTWGQGCGYNDNCPITSNPDFCYRSPTGCVPTAMAQIMYYWRWPQQYNWNSMSPTGPSSETARLMADIGFSGFVSGPRLWFADYGVAATGAWPDQSPGVFMNGFGYSTASADAAPNSVIYSNIMSGMPVMLGGFTEESSFLAWSWGAGAGHEWVGEGYLSWYMYLPMIGGFGFTQYYLNWGWDGSSNGWYSQYNPPGYNFMYDNNIVYNIHP